MGYVFQFVQQHAATVVMLAAAVMTAFSSTLPEQRPITRDEYWAWFRDFVHQIGNARPRPTDQKP